MSTLYEDVRIRELTPGPRRVSFKGRVVNMYDQNVESKMPQAAKGCLKLLIRDDDGGDAGTFGRSHWRQERGQCRRLPVHGCLVHDADDVCPPRAGSCVNLLCLGQALVRGTIP